MGIKRVLGVALVAVALGAVTVAPASAAPEGNKIVEIRSAADGLCLDLSRADSAWAGMSACDGSAAQQFERVPSVAGDGSYLRKLGTDTCLNGYNGTVTTWPCETAEIGERFREVPDTDGAVKLSAVGRWGTRFADSVLFQSGSGVNMLDASTRPTQRWLVREVGVVPPPQLGAAVKLKSADEGTCLSNSNPAFYNELSPCATAPGFERIDVGGGKVALRSQESAKCLAAAPRSGSAVGLDVCDTTRPDQQWTVTGDELGNYTVANGEEHLTPFSDYVITYPFAGIGLLQHWRLLPA